MQHRHLVSAEAFLEQTLQAQAQPDLRGQHQGGAALGQGHPAGSHVDLGLAAARYAVEQEWFESLVAYGRFDLGEGLGLGRGVHLGLGLGQDGPADEVLDHRAVGQAQPAGRLQTAGNGRDARVIAAQGVQGAGALFA